MTVAYADARPEGLNVPFRPGNTLHLEMTGWPAGSLVGRTFTSTLGGTALALAVVGDVITIDATEAQTLAVTDPAVWLLTETTSGASNDLLIGTWSPSTRPGTPTSLAVTVAVGAIDVAVTVVAATAPATVIEHRFGTDGWTPFTTRVIVTGDAPQVYTPSVATRRGRITASAAADSELREWFLHEATNWPDIEVEATFYAPSNWDTGPPINRPQQGIVVRAQQVPGSPGVWRGFVVWLDMLFATSGMLANTWQGDGGSVLTQGDGGSFTGPSLNLVRRQLHVRYARRINAFDVAQYWCAPDARTPDMWGMVDGDSVNLASMTDTSFNRTGVAVGNLSTVTKFFQVADTTANDNIDAIAGGTVDFVSLLKSHWPRRVGVLLEGTTLLAKHWRPEEEPPDWGDSDQVAQLTMPTSPALPSGPGLAGVVAGHIHDSAWLEYGDLTFKKR